MAIDSVWMPSCCCTCNAVRLALSSAMSASTRLPTPSLRISISVVWNSVCNSSRLAETPSSATWELTETIADSIRVRAAEAAELLVRTVVSMPMPVGVRFWALTVMELPSTVLRILRSAEFELICA